MVFHQHKTIRVLAPFHHITFAVADSRQLGHPLLQIRSASEFGEIALARFGFARRDQAAQRLFSQGAAYGLNKLHREFGMRVGKAGFAQSRQFPDPGRTSHASGFVLGFDQAVFGQLHELLAGGFPGDAQGRSQFRGGLGTLGFEPQKQAIRGQTGGGREIFQAIS
jgi:hypothetical protein